MSEKTSGPTSPPQWPEASQPKIAHPSSPLTTSSTFSPSIDESPDFHDPYSELNLFLAQKVKEEMKNAGAPKKWSIYFQEKLIEKIAPEFQQKFPHYRLGLSALKKIWEKVAYFSQTLENQKGALTKEGRLNTGYLIRENLKQHLGSKKSFSFHPYLLAQQLALKISECLATYEGIRPALQHITKTIWAVQKHLIPPHQIPSLSNPYDEFDKWDKLILKLMVEVKGKEPQLSQESLQEKVREALHALQNLSIPSSLDLFTANLSVLLADKLYPTLAFHTDLLDNQKTALTCFLHNHLLKYKNWQGSFTELLLRLKTIYFHTYTKEGALPFLKADDLETILWKMIQEEGLAQPFPTSKRIEEELGYLLIDNPHQSLSWIVDTAAQFFKKAQDLIISTNWVEIEHKITLWTIQGDLVYRTLRIEQNPLLLLLKKEKPAQALNSYLQQYPWLSFFIPQLQTRLNIFDRYIWYAVSSTADQSTVERYFQWHLTHQTFADPLATLEALCKRELPLLPFEQKHVELLLLQGQEKADRDKREAEQLSHR